MGRRAALLVTIGCVAIVAIVWWFLRDLARPGRGAEPADLEGPIHQAYSLRPDLFDRAYERESVEPAKDDVVGGIIPHHLLASHLIARFFLGLESQAPSVVVVVGPNHYSVGRGLLITSEAAWRTPYGVIEPASEIIRQLLETDEVMLDEDVFIREHSISAEVAFIRRSFPEAMIVPLVVKDVLPLNQAAEFGRSLAETLPEDAIVIASVDFSHYLSSPEAMAEDARSRPVLESLSTERLEEVAVDSRPSLAILFEFAKQRGVTKGTLLENENTATVVGDPSIPEVTSYFTGYLAR